MLSLLALFVLQAGSFRLVWPGLSSGVTRFQTKVVYVWLSVTACPRVFCLPPRPVLRPPRHIPPRHMLLVPSYCVLCGPIIQLGSGSGSRFRLRLGHRAPHTPSRVEVKTSCGPILQLGLGLGSGFRLMLRRLAAPYFSSQP